MRVVQWGSTSSPGLAVAPRTKTFPAPGNRTVNASPDLVIGLEERGSQDQFGDVVGMAVDEDGRIFVLDAMLSRVSVFDRNGRFVRAIGRKGSGPGEFTRPHGDVMRAGNGIALAHDTIFVLEQRLQAFDTSGTYLASTPPEVAFTNVNSINVTRNGIILERNPFVRVGVSTRHFSYLDFGTMMEKGGFSFTEIYQVSEQYPTNSGPPIPLPFLPFSAAPDGRVYFAIGDSLHVNALNIDGVPELTFVSSIPRVQITPDDVDQFLRGIEEHTYNTMVSQSPARVKERVVEVERRIRSRRPARFREAIGFVIVSDRGAVLLRRSDLSTSPYNPYSGAPTVWMLVPSDAATANLIHLPGEFLPRVFKGCSVYGVTVARDGVQTVVRYVLPPNSGC